MHLTREELLDIEQQVDAAFLRVTGCTWREDSIVPADSLESIARDYPTLFKTKGETP